MDIHKFIQKEREIWHDRFVPSIIAAIAVLIITIVLQKSGFDIVLLTTIASSIVILTNQHIHKLTVIGTTIYAYIVATLVGLLFIYLRERFVLSTPAVSFLTITTITLVIYLFNVFHPPAVGIALGIVLYKGTLVSLLFILSITIVLFVVLKMVMYMYYEHLHLAKFQNEFLIWKRRIFTKGKRFD